MLRLRRYLTEAGQWSKAIEQRWLQQCGADIDAEVNAYLELAPPPVSAMFDYQFAELPHDLRAQRAAAMALV